MTITRVSTVTCNACGKDESSLDDRFTCGGPLLWAEVSWERPVTETDDTTRKAVYEQIDLCPDHLGMLLKMIADVRKGLIMTDLSGELTSPR